MGMSAGGAWPLIARLLSLPRLGSDAPLSPGCPFLAGRARARLLVTGPPRPQCCYRLAAAGVGLSAEGRRLVSAAGRRSSRTLPLPVPRHLCRKAEPAGSRAPDLPVFLV